MSQIKSQVYCDTCAKSYWLELESKDVGSNSGIIQKALIHFDHILIVDIDKNGVIRKSNPVKIEFDPSITLIDDIAQAFHYITTEPGNQIVIDFYTSNNHLTKFIQSIMIKMFEHVATRKVNRNSDFSIRTFEDKMSLHSNRLNISIGSYIKSETDNPSIINGLVLDIIEAEVNKLNVDNILNEYAWVAIIVPRKKKEGYSSAFTSYFEKMKIPFFIDYLDNETLRELFDFIITNILEGIGEG